MTREVDPGERRSADTVLRTILRGAQLESVTFRSTVLTLGFFHPEAEGREDHPTYVWLTTIAAAGIANDPSVTAPVEDSGMETFQDGRAEFLPAVYRLMGDEIASVTIANVPWLPTIRWVSE